MHSCVINRFNCISVYVSILEMVADFNKSLNEKKVLHTAGSNELTNVRIGPPETFWENKKDIFVPYFHGMISV